jgi:hypothetical protein
METETANGSEALKSSNVFECESGGFAVKFMRRFVVRLLNFATGRRADQRLQEASIQSRPSTPNNVVGVA